jgi:hypothetical protein
MIGDELKLFDTTFLVAVDSSEAEEKLFWPRQTTDEVIRHAQSQIGISGVGSDH